MILRTIPAYSPSTRARGLRIVRVLALCGFFALPSPGEAPASATWARWLAAAESGSPLPFPDFSYAGYEASEKAIPDAKGPVFRVTDFGAVADDEKSDKEAIRKAIAAASAKGGTVFFPKGRYLAHAEGDDNESIRLGASGVVLKGEGAGPGGTIIHYAEAMSPVNPTSPLQSGPALFRWQLPDGAPRDETLTVLTADVRPGSREVAVKDASAIRPGDLIYFDLKSKEAIPDFLAPYELEPGWAEMGQGGVLIKERHQVESVTGNTLRLRGVAHLPLKAAWNVAVRRNTVMTQVGVEDIHFTALWKDPFKHHRSWMDDGGYTGLLMERVAHSWIRRCRFTDFNHPFSIIQALHTTLLHISMEGNGGHGGCGIYNSTDCLAALIDESAPHWHGPGVAKGALVNVFWRNDWTEESSIEMHASAPWGNLWDACTGGLIYARDGGDRKNLPNHLGKLIYWNFRQVGAARSDYSFWRGDSQWGRQVKPILVGWHGEPTTFKAETCEVVESLGAPVAPGSLFEAQLARRLGRVPAWLDEARARWPALLAEWGVKRTAPESSPALPASVPYPKADASAAMASARPQSAGPAQVSPKATLIAHWRFEESGEKISDSAGAFHGKAIQAERVDGPVGRAIRLSGQPQASLDFPPLPAFDKAVSILFWVKVGPAERYQNIVMKAQGSAREFGLFIRGSLKWSAGYAGMEKPSSEDTGLVLTDDAWHHVAVVYDGERKSLVVWVDGKEAKRLPTPGASLAGGTAPIRLGQGLGGCLDEVMLFRGVVDGETIRSAARR